MKPAQPSLRSRNNETARNVVLDAAERLLRNSETADFSMRALAAEAGVGFATPFNHFGNKNAIMQALSARLIARMAARFGEMSFGRGPNDNGYDNAIDRVLVMGRIAAAVLLEQPKVYRMVIGSLGVVSTVPSSVRPRSEALWTLALGEFTGLAPALKAVAEAILPEQLAFAFRGAVSFWIAGELADVDLAAAVETGALVLLMGFADPARRTKLEDQLNTSHRLRGIEPV